MTSNQGSATFFIVEEIRLSRIHIGMTQEAFARAAGFSASHVSSVETGTRALTREYAKGADVALKTGGLFLRLLDRAAGGMPTYFRPWAASEAVARSLRQYEPAVIPGLLQTEEYMRALLAEGGHVQAEEVEPAVTARLERQHLLDRNPPADLAFVVDEVALRHNPGSPEMMREQLERIVKMIEARRIRLTVIPDKLVPPAGLSGNFVLARLPEGGLVGYSESSLQGHVTDKPEDLDILEVRWTRLCMAALSPTESIEMIKKVIQWH